jgi:hypothetical protein
MECSQKAQTVLWCSEFEPIIRVQREFRLEFGVRSPDDKSTRRWFQQFRLADSVKKDGIGHLMKLWIVLGRLLCGVK